MGGVPPSRLAAAMRLLDPQPPTRSGRGLGGLIALAIIIYGTGFLTALAIVAPSLR